MILEPIILSFIVGKLRGGKLSNLENLEIKTWYLLLIAALIQVSMSLANKFLGQLNIEDKGLFFTIIHGLSYLLMLACVLLNIKKTSMKIILLGILLNFLVIFANGGQMPVSLENVKGIENKHELPTSEFDIKHKLVDEDTKFKHLADIIAISRPYPFPKILSIGDIFLMIGLYVFFQEGMLNKNREVHNSE